VPSRLGPCGVYAIRRIGAPENRCYVGSSVGMDCRWKGHAKDLRAGRHHSFLFQRAWDKYGESAFEFVVLEMCDRADIDAREQAWIDKILPAYNVARFVKSPMKGRRASAETIARQSAAQKGRPKPPRTEDQKRRNREATRAFYAALTPDERRELMRKAFEKRASVSARSLAMKAAWASKTPEARTKWNVAMHAAHPYSRKIRPQIKRRVTSRKMKAFWAAMREGADGLHLSHPELSYAARVVMAYRSGRI